MQKEAEKRGYNFDLKKVDWNFKKTKIGVTNAQVAYEVKHLMKKLKDRDPQKHKEQKKLEFRCLSNV